VSSQLSTEIVRGLDPGRSETLERLLVAATEELEQVGHETLTIRNVAQRAGLAPATAYTYLASKDHLYSALFWRLLATAPEPELPDGPPVVRVQATLRHLATVIAESPAIAAAATRSLLSTDPSVQRLRLLIGVRVVDQLRVAIGEGEDADRVEAVVDAVSLAFFGALLHAGMGMSTYAKLADRLDRVVDVIMGGAG
jgi:AcrR family transcriptional regulator